MKATKFLRDCEVFSTLSDTELEQIESSASEKQYEAGVIIFEEGDSADELLVLQEGKIVLQMSLPTAQAQMDRRITVDIVTRNEVLNWSAVVEPHVYTLTAVCLQKSTVLSISAIKLRSLLQDKHHIGYAVMKGMVKVAASRLSDTRQLLVSERLLTSVPKSNFDSLFR